MTSTSPTSSSSRGHADQSAQVLPVASGNWELADGGSVRWAFTGRIGGVSLGPFAGANLSETVADDPQAIAANRAAAARLVGARAESLVVMRAEHGSAVATVGAEAGGTTVASVDALVTAADGLALMALSADCVPLVLADLDAGVVSAVHCGWRGVIAGVVPATIAAMRDAGADPERIRAVVGPRICGPCYEVGPEVADQFAQAHPNALGRAGDAVTVDVGVAVLNQLGAGGVAQVDVVDLCTAEDLGLFSYRRDGLTGRQGAIVALAATGSAGVRQDH